MVFWNLDSIVKRIKALERQEQTPTNWTNIANTGSGNIPTGEQRMSALTLEPYKIYQIRFRYKDENDKLNSLIWTIEAEDINWIKTSFKIIGAGIDTNETSQFKYIQVCLGNTSITNTKFKFNIIGGTITTNGGYNLAYRRIA